MTVLRAIILTLLLPVSALAAREAKQPGQEVYSEIQPSVFKVKTAANEDSPQASYGTAFVVAEHGLLITNYHVVSDAFLNPKRRHLYLVTGDTSTPADILAIDILQDLALISVPLKFKKWLRFSAQKPRQGEVIYSIGQPEDLNMAITVGTYNSELNYSRYSIIHMSTPINSGMSGGPTVNKKGQIVGVNVAKSVGSDSLSFSVPGHYAQTLLQRGAQRTETQYDVIWSEIEDQLFALQKDLTDDITESALKPATFGIWQVAGMTPSLRCWSRTTDDDRIRYDMQEHVCYLAQSAYLSDDTRTGYFRTTVQKVKGMGLNPWQFFSLLGSFFSDLNFDDGTSQNLMPLLTNGHCDSDLISNSYGVPFKVVICGRGYSRLHRLRDYKVSYTTLFQPSAALLGEVELRGFTVENVQRVLRSLLSQVRRTGS